jgi:hypothetical protein
MNPALDPADGKNYAMPGRSSGSRAAFRAGWMSDGSCQTAQSDCVEDMPGKRRQLQGKRLRLERCGCPQLQFNKIITSGKDTGELYSGV